MCGYLMSLCTTKNDPVEISLWVKSDAFGSPALVSFTPNSDRLVRRRKAPFPDGMADKFALFLVGFFQY
jgi:hypothetical protein